MGAKRNCPNPGLDLIQNTAHCKCAKLEQIKTTVTYALSCVAPTYRLRENRVELVPNTRVLQWYFVIGDSKTESRYFLERNTQGYLWGLRDSENHKFKVIGCMRTVLYHLLVREKAITHLSEYESFMKVH